MWQMETTYLFQLKYKSERTEIVDFSGRTIMELTKGEQIIFDQKANLKRGIEYGGGHVTITNIRFFSTASLKYSI